jgi:hypothetical protein
MKWCTVKRHIGILVYLFIANYTKMDNDMNSSKTHTNC